MKIERFWTLLFALGAIFATGCFVYAPLNDDWWLLPNVSSVGKEIDHLFMIILGITGVVFIATQVVLCYILWKFYDRPGRKADYVHGQMKLEVIWTIIPASILVFLALYQMGTWAKIKFRSSLPKVQPIAEVTGRQFQWVFRYAGEDRRLHTDDDVFTVNNFHFVQDEPTVIHLKSSDVLHSFFLPSLRIKQDAVPGLTIPVWFDSSSAGKFELVCAELCGWGHYKMRGNVTIHQSQQEFEEWLKQTKSEQDRDQLSLANAANGG
ncbi:MAG: cytochrome c oxidase subunit II [Isosphaeraceae bacterium]